MIDLDAIERNYGDGQITVSLWPDHSDEQRTTHKRLNAVWIAAPLLIAEIRRLREELDVAKKTTLDWGALSARGADAAGYRRGVEAAAEIGGKWVEGRIRGSLRDNIRALLDNDDAQRAKGEGDAK